MKAATPENERERLAALRALDILDTDTEKAFDDLCFLASQICATPVSLISFVDDDRQWFKSKVGITLTQTSRDIAFCAHAILQKDLFVVTDAMKDKRFADNPLVSSDPKIRFYAGAPLITSDGFPVGTLCVMDHVPRVVTPDQHEAIRILRDQVVRLLDLRRREKELRRAHAQQEKIQRILHETEQRFFHFLDAVPVGVFVIDKDGNPFYANQQAQNILGRGIVPGAKAEELADKYHAFLTGTTQEYPAEKMPIVRALSGEASMITDMEIHRKGRTVPVQVWGAPIYDSEGRITFAIVAFSDISDRSRTERRLAAMYAATSALAESDSLSQAASKIAQVVCETMQWDVGAIYELDRKESVLRCVDFWHSPTVAVPDFEALTRQLTFPSGIGLPGRVLATGKPAWIKDVVKDTNFPRVPAALKNNLHGAFGFPILVLGQVTGVLEFFSREIQEPDEQLLEMLGNLGTQIGQFLIRKRVEQRQQRLLEELSRYGVTDV